MEDLGDRLTKGPLLGNSGWQCACVCVGCIILTCGASAIKNHVARLKLKVEIEITAKSIVHLPLGRHQKKSAQ